MRKGVDSTEMSDEEVGDAADDSFFAVIPGGILDEYDDEDENEGRTRQSAARPPPGFASPPASGGWVGGGYHLFGRPEDAVIAPPSSTRVQATCDRSFPAAAIVGSGRFSHHDDDVGEDCDDGPRGRHHDDEIAGPPLLPMSPRPRAHSDGCGGGGGGVGSTPISNLAGLGGVGVQSGIGTVGGIARRDELSGGGAAAIAGGVDGGGEVIRPPPSALPPPPFLDAFPSPAVVAPPLRRRPPPGFVDVVSGGGGGGHPTHWTDGGSNRVRAWSGVTITTPNLVLGDYDDNRVRAWSAGDDTTTGDAISSLASSSMSFAQYQYYRPTSPSSALSEDSSVLVQSVIHRVMDDEDDDDDDDGDSDEEDEDVYVSQSRQSPSQEAHPLSPTSSIIHASVDGRTPPPHVVMSAPSPSPPGAGGRTTKAATVAPGATSGARGWGTTAVSPPPPGMSGGGVDDGWSRSSSRQQQQRPRRDRQQQGQQNRRVRPPPPTIATSGGVRRQQQPRDGGGRNKSQQQQQSRRAGPGHGPNHGPDPARRSAAVAVAGGGEAGAEQVPGQRSSESSEGGKRRTAAPPTAATASSAAAATAAAAPADEVRGTGGGGSRRRRGRARGERSPVRTVAVAASGSGAGTKRRSQRQQQQLQRQQMSSSRSSRRDGGVELVGGGLATTPTHNEGDGDHQGSRVVAEGAAMEVEQGTDCSSEAGVPGTGEEAAAHASGGGVGGGRKCSRDQRDFNPGRRVGRRVVHSGNRRSGGGVSQSQRGHHGGANKDVDMDGRECDGNGHVGIAERLRIVFSEMISTSLSVLHVPPWLSRIIHVDYITHAKHNALKFTSISALILRVALRTIAEVTRTLALVTFHLHRLALREATKRSQNCRYSVVLTCYAFASTYPPAVALAGEYWTFPHWLPQFVWNLIVVVFVLRLPLLGGLLGGRRDGDANPGNETVRRNREAEAKLLLRRISRGGRDGMRARREAARLSLELDLPPLTTTPSSDHHHHNRDCHHHPKGRGRRGRGRTRRLMALLRFTCMMVVRPIVIAVVLTETVTSTQGGFVMDLGGSELLLVGFVLAVIRTGHLRSSLVWISWSIQVVILRFWPNPSRTNDIFVEHVLLVLGLASLHLVTCGDRRRGAGETGGVDDDDVIDGGGGPWIKNTFLRRFEIRCTCGW